jgi:hypothetical protein
MKPGWPEMTKSPVEDRPNTNQKTAGGMPPSPGLEQIGVSLQERRAAVQRRTVLIFGSLIVLSFLSLVPLLWTEFIQLSQWAFHDELVLKVVFDDLVRGVFFKLGYWFVVTLVVEIIALIWLVRTSGVNCSQCGKTLLFPARWEQAETHGVCPCCRAPITNLYPAGERNVAKDRAERLRLLTRDYKRLLFAVVCWSIVMALSLIGLVRGDDWALILVCSNAAVLVVNCALLQFVKLRIRQLAKVDATRS